MLDTIVMHFCSHEVLAALVWSTSHRMTLSDLRPAGLGASALAGISTGWGAKGAASSQYLLEGNVYEVRSVPVDLTHRVCRLQMLQHAAVCSDMFRCEVFEP